MSYKGLQWPSLLPVPTELTEISKLSTANKAQVVAAKECNGGNEIEPCHHKVSYAHEEISASHPRVCREHYSLHTQNRQRRCFERHLWQSSAWYDLAVMKKDPTLKLVHALHWQSPNLNRLWNGVHWQWRKYISESSKGSSRSSVWRQIDWTLPTFWGSLCKTCTGQEWGDKAREKKGEGIGERVPSDRHKRKCYIYSVLQHSPLYLQ